MLFTYFDFINENNQLVLKNIQKIAYDKGWIKPGFADYAIYLGDDIVATVFLDDEKTELYIRGFEVKSEFRGKGYAKKVLDVIRDYAKENNFKKLSLNYNKKNIIAGNLYRSYGFTESEYQREDSPVINMEMDII